jgi:FYVE, RhoGEF and PH domain containing 5/6
MYSPVTLSLNTSLHTHIQTLSLLALQRSTASLPPNLHFISPGRTLLQRGPLVMLERSGEGFQREFLLFSDILVWLESENVSKVNVPISSGRGSGGAPVNPVRPGLIRTRSKSEAELSGLKARFAAASEVSLNSPDSPASPYVEYAPPPASAPVAKVTHTGKTSSSQHSAPPNVKRHASASNPNSVDDKWVFKGTAQLVDLEVVVVGGADEAQERRFEILSPEGSFAVYAGMSMLDWLINFYFMCMSDSL